MGDFQCRECGNDAEALCEKCNAKYEDAELTRLRAELAEARRHAKVLAEVLSPYKEYSGEVEAALDYVEKLP